MDVQTPEGRSYNMSRIRSKDTKLEVVVRKYLFSRGIRYRKNDRRYPGKPDIVLPKYRTVIFIHGCFWHSHEACPGFKLPNSNIEYWIPKLVRNRQRDSANTEVLQSAGWRVIVIWGCELKKKAAREARLQKLYEEITTYADSKKVDVKV